MGTDHELATRDYLDANAGLGVSIYAGGFRPGMEDDAIVCRATSSLQSEYKFGAPEEIKRPEIRIIVRGAPSARKATKDRADSVWDTLSGASPTGYMAVYMRGSGPNALGRDGSKRWRFSVLARLMIDE